MLWRRSVRTVEPPIGNLRADQRAPAHGRGRSMRGTGRARGVVY
jgi:hypothetical protein